MVAHPISRPETGSLPETGTAVSRSRRITRVSPYGTSLIPPSDRKAANLAAGDFFGISLAIYGSTDAWAVACEGLFGTRQTGSGARTWRLGRRLSPADGVREFDTIDGATREPAWRFDSRRSDMRVIVSACCTCIRPSGTWRTSLRLGVIANSSAWWFFAPQCSSVPSTRRL
jgi:hypothetical protein